MSNKNKLIASSILFHFFLSTVVGQSKLIDKEHDIKLTGEIIVELNSEVQINYNQFIKDHKSGNKVFDSLNKVHGLIKVERIGKRGDSSLLLLGFDKKNNIHQTVQSYAELDIIKQVEPDFVLSGNQTPPSIIPNDNFFNLQWGLLNNKMNNPLFVPDADIDMEFAWGIETGDSSIIVAIIDGGIKFDHPEFLGRIWYNPSEFLNNQDSDNNGYMDDYKGWDFVNNDNNPTDDYGHGTSVTGVLGANGNNAYNYAGVDWKCQLMILKALDSQNNGSNSGVIAAIYYAADNGAKVINLSLSTLVNSSFMQNAVDYAHNRSVTLVACVGNNNNNFANYPAAFNSVIAVGATNSKDQRASPFSTSSANSGSNFGSYLDVVAPGDAVFILSHVSNVYYYLKSSGTSFAAPLVSGLCALLLAQDKTLTPTQIKNIIRSTSEDQVGNPNEDVLGFDNYYGYGRINAYKALLSLQTVNNTEIELISNSLKVYPNPTRGILNVEHCNNCKEVRIININGEMVLQELLDVSQESYKLNTSNLAEGVYTMVVITNKGQQLVQKLVLSQ